MTARAWPETNRRGRPSEIAVKEADDIGRVLLGERPVEVIFRAEGRDLRLGGVISEGRHGGIGGNDVRDRERDDRDADHHGRDPDDAS